MDNNPTQYRRLKPGDVRVVTINGKPATLVIGRSYVFRMKPGVKPPEPTEP